MFGIANRLALIVPAAFALAVVATSMWPAVSNAAQCGEGTQYDAPSNMCVVAAQAPPPQALPPPAPNGPRPNVWVGICAPIRIVSICAGI
ncbi:hypothetical protein BN1232_03337 [Mycobacterium numidiamassiliense]|uniref:Uncharacterized protein n=1 Tax=Mycobacterium numidiamassiliense TaxID=1841861 RepID=A0A2U3PF33_9MYCO|nr:hypothetical protein BN1232_03337 [Mycobacterium numidiamassiliense]